MSADPTRAPEIEALLLEGRTLEAEGEPMMPDDVLRGIQIGLVICGVLLVVAVLGAMLPAPFSCR